MKVVIRSNRETRLKFPSKFVHNISIHRPSNNTRFNTQNVSITYTISCMIDYTLAHRHGTSTLSRSASCVRVLFSHYSNAPLIFFLSVSSSLSRSRSFVEIAWAKPRDRAAHHTRDTVVKDQAIVVRWLTSSHCLPRGRVIEDDDDDDDEDYVSHTTSYIEGTKDFEDRFRRGRGEGKNNCGGSER